MRNSWTPSLHRKARVTRFRGTRISIGMAALLPVLAAIACAGSEPASLPERNSPPGQTTFFVDTDTDYFEDLGLISTSNPEASEDLESLRAKAVPMWIGGRWELEDDRMRSVLERSRKNGTIPMFVLYNIPDRDLGSFSGGGAEDDEAYLAWISDVSHMIADQSALVILEPDALGHVPDMGPEEAENRLKLIAEALDILSANANTATYLDVGNATWLQPEVAADLIGQVGRYADVKVSGVALNVANYISEGDTRDYAEQLEQELGRKLFVLIDNSRNGGSVGDGAWCNPEGQRLGQVDNTFSSDEHIETVYVKIPGDSDGQCGLSDAAAGEFDGELLLYQLGYRS